MVVVVVIWCLLIHFMPWWYIDDLGEPQRDAGWVNYDWRHRYDQVTGPPGHLATPHGFPRLSCVDGLLLESQQSRPRTATQTATQFVLVDSMCSPMGRELQMQIISTPQGLLRSAPTRPKSRRHPFSSDRDSTRRYSAVTSDQTPENFRDDENNNNTDEEADFDDDNDEDGDRDDDNDNDNDSNGQQGDHEDSSIMAYSRHRPISHFIAPHSWSNDPCGAVYVPESQEYLLCYQWNPGTTEAGNCAWGMAKSKDLVTWTDCMPALWNGSSYDSLGVFSGSITSRLVDGKRVLYLFYTSVSALPIHWSKPYINGCETQSLAVSTDLGQTWVRHASNPLIKEPPKAAATSGWRDPFVSPSASLSRLLGLRRHHDFMMLSSGERGRGPQLHLYASDDLTSWAFISTVLDVQLHTIISHGTDRKWGINFECASFFTLGETDYIIVGMEESEESTCHNAHYVLWVAGTFSLNEQGLPAFEMQSHGVLDHGILYAAHIFRDENDRLLQLGWADESANKHMVRDQGWAGCLGHPRELTEVKRPVDADAPSWPEWKVDETAGTMTTLGIRPAPQVDTLRAGASTAGPEALAGLQHLSSVNFEMRARFTNLTGSERFVFHVLSSPDGQETTRLVFDVDKQTITVDRSQSSLETLGTTSPDSGPLRLLPGEHLDVRIFVDVSVIEIYANDRFALTSRVYPSLDVSNRTRYDFGGFDESNVELEYWPTMKRAWPERDAGPGILPELLPRARPETSRGVMAASEMPVEMAAAL
ncbi:hypothetical protein E4U53_000167 [Claviceps sorghi]|nr:hypothetical protein E4U53_000167 [Claviceps sorghi]